MECLPPVACGGCLSLSTGTVSQRAHEWRIFDGGQVPGVLFSGL